MKLIKEIRSKDDVLHFKRWRLLKTPWFEVYIHGIYHKDEDKHLHNHPWNIWTMILWGSYIEELMGKDCKSTKHKIRTFLNMGYRNSERFHCIREVISKKSLHTGHCWKKKISRVGLSHRKRFCGPHHI